MKALIVAAVATAAILASTAASAQSDEATAGTQTQAVAQQPTATGERQGPHHWYSFIHRGAGRASNPNNGCVGPASYCNVFFGS